MTSIKTILGTVTFVCVFWGILQINSNKTTYNYVSVDTIKVDTVATGKENAKVYCSMCHEFPEPDLLNKETWVLDVLPNMGLRLGVINPEVNPNAGLNEKEISIMQKLGVIPYQPLIPDDKWKQIVEYYKKEAPFEPKPQMNESIIKHDLDQFVVKPIVFDDKPLPKTTMLKFNTSSSKLYVGDGQHYLYVLDGEMKLLNKKEVQSAPVDIDFPDSGAPRLLSIGVFPPSDKRIGTLTSLEEINVEENPNINITGLPRSVQFATGDLNMDGNEDVVVCGFGNITGKLMWYDNFDITKEHMLKNLPGAVKVEIQDFNNDGKPDIMVLMAQAYEQMSIYYNLGNNNFEEKVILKFSPLHGVSYFETMDFNNDGFLDILLTNGDNWDYSPIKKNYHGIRIYLNDGKDNFKETFFYPLYGATKAIARDFDKDGDLDLAAISFYADHEKPEHGFVYLSNDGDNNFNAFSTPKAADGKWLTMEVGDFDKDGDLDIVLGSYFHKLSELTKLIFKGVLSFPQLLVLTNKIK